ncbi:MAG: hypothetical protein E6277_07875 [Actinomyces sp.]|nr:hypothetical protein [Actinomyces sp.]MDU7239719.1 hypothetical protein [Actinomyces sp.]
MAPADIATVTVAPAPACAIDTLASRETDWTAKLDACASLMPTDTARAAVRAAWHAWPWLVAADTPVSIRAKTARSAGMVTAVSAVTIPASPFNLDTERRLDD